VDKYLTKNIKDILRQYPKIKTILLDYHFSCVTCAADSCRLRDSIDLHKLSIKEERCLLARISGVILARRETVVPQQGRTGKSKDVRFSRPIRRPMRELKSINR
jgi:hypothetical protein